MGDEREKTMPTLTINGQRHEVTVEPDTPLLWVLRDTLGMTGTKYGCGIAQCGACTVHVNGVATRSCSVPLSAVAGAEISTIEGPAQAPTSRYHRPSTPWPTREEVPHEFRSQDRCCQTRPPFLRRQRRHARQR